MCAALCKYTYFDENVLFCTTYNAPSIHAYRMANTKNKNGYFT